MPMFIRRTLSFWFSFFSLLFSLSPYYNHIISKKAQSSAVLRQFPDANLKFHFVDDDGNRLNKYYSESEIMEQIEEVTSMKGFFLSGALFPIYFLITVVVALFIYLISLDKENSPFFAFCLLITMVFNYMRWAVQSSFFILHYEKKMNAIYELLFHNQKHDKNCEAIIEDCRLDPSMPDNIRNWLVLRIKLIEDQEMILRINNSLNMMNRSVIACTLVVLYSLYQFVVKEINVELQGQKANYFGILIFFFTISIILPVLQTLNIAVETVEMIENGCNEILNQLKVNVKMLMWIQQDEHTKECYQNFLDQIQNVKTVVEEYKIPAHLFLWAVKISPTVRNTYVSLLTTSLGAIIYQSLGGEPEED